MKLGQYDINEIYNEDCLEAIKKLPNKCIDCIITDPPYFLGVTHNGQKGEYSDLAMMRPFFDSLFFQFERILQPEGKMYLCCDYRTYPFFYPIAEQYHIIRNLLVWDKVSGAGNFYAFTHEFVMFCCNSVVNMKGKNIITGIPSFAGGAKKTNGEKIHPTQKTVELFEKFILDSTNEGDVVLDAFMGSGTLAIAAIKNNRNFIGFELQEKYCKIAKERVETFKGNFVTIENMKQEITLFHQ